MNGKNSYKLDNGVEIYKFQAKDSDKNAAPLYLVYVSKVNNMKKAEIYGYD